MSDIVERLRKRADGRTTGTHFNLLLDAAEAVERLRSELASAREAAFEEAAQIAESLPRITDVGGGLNKHTDHTDAARAIRARAQEGR